MLDQLFPVQYVEGLNEYAKPTNQSVRLSDGHWWAVPYRAKTSYTLSRLACWLDSNIGDPKFKMRLYTDFEDLPGDIVLAEGDWEGQRHDNWLEISFGSPVVVVADRQYWIAIHPTHGPIMLPIATQAIGVPIRFFNGQRWLTEDSMSQCNAMLRFYGRFPPSLQVKV